MNSPADKKPTPPPTPLPTPVNPAVQGGKGTPPSVPPDNKTAASTAPPDDKEGEGTEADKAANRSKLFIVVGQVHEFATAAKAEQFLNQPDAPKTFKVIRGHEVQSKQRVSPRG